MKREAVRQTLAEFGFWFVAHNPEDATLPSVVDLRDRIHAYLTAVVELCEAEHAVGVARAVVAQRSAP